MNSRELTHMFFKELKKYNLTNFKTLERADLQESNPIVHKAFSSVVTRYFIFCERHPEISDIDKRILYFKLKIDMIASYFSDYPESNTDILKAFQSELRTFVKDASEGRVSNADRTF